MIDPNYNQLQNNIAALKEDFDKLSAQQLESGRIIRNVLNTQINAPAYPTANMLYNGELGHSIYTWNNLHAGTNWVTSCAFFYTHAAPYATQELFFTSLSGVANNSIKTPSDPYYDASYTDWDSTNGQARLNGTTTLDTYLPTNFVDATTPLARASLIAAKRNQYIELPSDCLMFAGLWDNTSGQRDWLTGTLGFSATLNAVAASTVERRYKIVFLSDRGFTLVSPEITIANAPADGYFSSTASISIGWKQQAGQLEVQIYEYIPSLSEYRLIQVVSAATSYIHEGDYLDIVGSYPTGTGTEGTAVYFTKESQMSDLATDQVSAKWDTVNFPIGIPADYDKSVTTANQWVRFGLTVAPNLYVTGVSTNGTTTITAPANVFESAYSSLFAGLTIEVYDQDGVSITTTTVSSRTNDTQIVLGSSIASGSNRIIRIVGGGFHGVLVDKIHIGFQQNTSYAPNVNDARALQPVAAPTSSSQGGVGDGGSSGGVYNCVVGSTPIKQGDGKWQEIKTAKIGDLWASAELHPNLLLKLRPGFDYVREVISENGCYLRCTDSERFVVDRNDSNGTPLSRLRVGDSVLTEIDGKIESSKIIHISERLGKEFVFTPTLSNNRLFVGGEVFPTFWQKIAKFFGRKQKQGGFVLHNLKDNFEREFYYV